MGGGYASSWPVDPSRHEYERALSFIFSPTTAPKHVSRLRKLDSTLTAAVGFARKWREFSLV
jgi:hypothetical protein